MYCLHFHPSQSPKTDFIELSHCQLIHLPPAHVLVTPQAQPVPFPPGQ